MGELGEEGLSVAPSHRRGKSSCTDLRLFCCGILQFFRSFGT